MCARCAARWSMNARGKSVRQVRCDASQLRRHRTTSWSRVVITLPCPEAAQNMNRLSAFLTPTAIAPSCMTAQTIEGESEIVTAHEGDTCSVRLYTEGRGGDHRTRIRCRQGIPRLSRVAVTTMGRRDDWQAFDELPMLTKYGASAAKPCRSTETEGNAVPLTRWGARTVAFSVARRSDSPLLSAEPLGCRRGGRRSCAGHAMWWAYRTAM